MLELDCGHACFHNHCVLQWFARAPRAESCPECRKAVKHVRRLGATVSDQLPVADVLACAECGACATGAACDADDVLFCRRCARLTHRHCSTHGGVAFASAAEAYECHGCNPAAHDGPESSPSRAVSGAGEGGEGGGRGAARGGGATGGGAGGVAAGGKRSAAQWDSDDCETAMTELVLLARSVRADIVQAAAGIAAAASKEQWASRAKLKNSLDLLARHLHRIAGAVGGGGSSSGGSSSSSSSSAGPSPVVTRAFANLAMAEFLCEEPALEFACQPEYHHVGDDLLGACAAAGVRACTPTERDGIRGWGRPGRH
jgi:hypothetical protein